jgi:hypothetical protein
MPMNALYMEYHLRHQNVRCHEHCLALVQNLPEQSKQRVPVSRLRHTEWFGSTVGILDTFDVSIVGHVHFEVCQIMSSSPFSYAARRPGVNVI